MTKPCQPRGRNGPRCELASCKDGAECAYDVSLARQQADEAKHVGTKRIAPPMTHASPHRGRVAKSYYHGGMPGLKVGDELLPSPPIVQEGCPHCEARASGRVYTVGEYRAWAQQFGVEGKRLLEMLEGAPDNAPVDPPSAYESVYVTTDLEYARFYAGRSRGDLYRVRPIGGLLPSPEDHFPTWRTDRAVVVEVLSRKVVRTRSQRRELNRRWRKADAMLEAP